MKRQPQHPDKNPSKQAEKSLSPENKHDFPFVDEEIEADAVDDPPLLTGEQTPSDSHLSQSSNKKGDFNLSQSSFVPSTIYVPKSTNGCAPPLATDIAINLFSQSDLHNKFVHCSKHPRHVQFVPIAELNVNHFPDNFRKPSWPRFIKLKATDVVKLSVSYTNENRPDELGFKDVKTVRHGSGTTFIYNMDKIEKCDCKDVESEHSASGLFRVLTASHVVFDDEEAKSTTVEFFYDSTDLSTIVKGWGVRVCLVDVERNRSIIECRTHDIKLCQRLKDAQRERNELLKKELQFEVGTAQTVVLISHPHGLCKQVSFGTLKEQIIVGEAKRTKEGVALVDCLLTYDTPTCPGTGGGPVNVIGGGTPSYAFAPHCASKSSGINLSGLGWATANTGYAMEKETLK